MPAVGRPPKSISLSDTIRTARFLGTKAFFRWTRKAGVSPGALNRAAAELHAGLFDADLGGGLLKKRIGLPGRGRRGGARLIVATRRGDRWVFLFGYVKANQENLAPEELEALRFLGRTLLSLSPASLERAIEAGEIEELPHEDKDQPRPSGSS